MSTPRIISDLIGTLQSCFRFGNVRLADSSGVVAVQNKAGTAFANVGASGVDLMDSDASNKITIAAPSAVGTDYTLTLPATDGDAGQFLVGDGSGTLSWSSVQTNAEYVADVAFSEAGGGTLVNAPANAIVYKTQIEVASAAAGGTPTVSIGTAADPDLITDELDTDLSMAGLYELSPRVSVGGSAVDLIVTVVDDSQTFSGTARIWYAVPA